MTKNIYLRQKLCYTGLLSIKNWNKPLRLHLRLKYDIKMNMLELSFKPHRQHHAIYQSTFKLRQFHSWNMTNNQQIYADWVSRLSTTSCPKGGNSNSKHGSLTEKIRAFISPQIIWRAQKPTALMKLKSTCTYMQIKIKNKCWLNHAHG